jgi:hypothetical protein
MDSATAGSIAQRDERKGALHRGTVAMRMGLAELLGVVLVALYVWRENWPIC